MEKKCRVPGLWGDLCRDRETAANDQPFCALWDAAIQEKPHGLPDLEETVRDLSDLCPQSDKVLEYTEQNKPK